MKRRTSFASPFILVAVAGCHGHGHSNPPGPANPPGPKVMTTEECKAVKVGEACSYDYGTCAIATEGDACGLQGYECKETAPGSGAFAWVENTRPCE